MRKHSYEWLTVAENNEVNILLTRLENHVLQTTMTVQEADYTFQKKIMKLYPDKAFTIFTNKDSFLLQQKEGI